jgi:uracil-DNA glycosylase family 4
MRATLNALTSELRRLQTAGVKTVSIGDETVAALRALVDSRKSNVDGALASHPTESRLGSSAPDFTVRSQLRQPPVGVSKAKPVEPLLPPPPVVSLPDGDKATRWAFLATLVEENSVCIEQLRPGKKTTFGVGSLDAKIFFCGDAPDEEDEEKRAPFVGPAGQLLTKMIGAMGLQRDEVYIGNIMNWRPLPPLIDGEHQLGTRPPTAEETAFCLPFLKAQIEIIQPEVVVALGAVAARGLLGESSFKALGEIRGKWNQFGETPVIVTYHPNYILRNQSNRSKRMIWEDLLQVMDRTGLPVSEKQRGYFLAS